MGTGIIHRTVRKLSMKYFPEYEMKREARKQEAICAAVQSLHDYIEYAERRLKEAELEGKTLKK